MDYHHQEQQFGQPLPPLMDDRMLYCPRPVMAGMSSPYDGFIRQYAGAGCATLPHHIPHHAMPPVPLNLGYQQVAPPVGYLPPPPSLHMSAAYVGARQYLSSMMTSPPMLVPHSHSSLYPDSQVALTPPMRPLPPVVGHVTFPASAGENNPPKDAILTQPPKLIPASVASRNREVNLSLKPPPLKSHPNKSKVSDSPSTLQSPPASVARTAYSGSELVNHAQRNNLLSYASSALQSWNRSTESRSLEIPEQTLDLTIRGLLTSKTTTAGTTTVTTIKTEQSDTPPVESVANAPHPIVDGATYNADEQKYTCLSCSYSTASVTKIQQHMKAHGGQLICEDCGKAFIQTCDLERHLNAHLHGRARNTGSRFNMADILLPQENSGNFDNLPGMIHHHGDMDATSIVQSEHVQDGRAVDSADWHAKSPFAPYSEHALSTLSSLPSMQHSNSCTSSDSDLAIVNCYSISQTYHDGPANQGGVARNVTSSEIRSDESEAAVVATQSLSEAALMRESYWQHLDSTHTSPTAGTVPKAPGISHAAVAMETTGSESAVMRTSPQVTAPSGERTVQDETGSVTHLATETLPQESTDLGDRFPYSGALAQAERDINERFSTSTSAPESVINENENTIDRNTVGPTSKSGLAQKNLDDVEDTNTNQQKTQVTPPHGSVSQQLIDHLLQSDESPSPSQGNDASDVLLSPQGAMSSLPVGGMFGEPPPMFLPDGSTDAITSPLRFQSADIVTSPPPLAGGVSLCCTLCNYTGRSQRSLQKHYKAHSMSYKICRYCGKAFERPSDLLRHEERHQMAIQRNHTPVITRGGNFSNKKSGGATGSSGSRAKSKHARVLHCRRCGFATTEHHILALHNKKQHQPSNWFCTICGQKFISKTSLELHCIVAHPVVAVRIDSYMKNVLTDTKVLSCSVGGDNIIQLDDVNTLWFDTLKEQEVPTVSTVTDLHVIVGQSGKHLPDAAIGVSGDFGGNIDRPVDLSMYSTSHDRNDVSPEEGLLDDSVQAADVAINNLGGTSQSGAMAINDSHLRDPCSADDALARDYMSSPARSSSCDSFTVPDSLSQDIGDSQPSAASQSGRESSKVGVKQREPRQPRIGRYTCDQCSYSSNILRKMTQHKHAHGGRYICKICYKAFIKTSDLTRHWITHGITLDGELKCDSCDYHSSDRESLEVHMKVHYHQRGIYRVHNSGKHRACTICHEWVYKKAMRKHLLRVHNWPPGGSTASKPDSPKIGLVNRSPQKSPADKAKLKKSPSSVLTLKVPGGALAKAPPGSNMSKQNRYACPECDESFSSSRAIIQHLLVAHPGETVAPHSGRKQVPSGTSGAVCELCNREFADTIRLARHKAWHTRVSHPSRRQCPICHKQFKTVTYLNQHMQLHSNQKPYECDRCGATFGLHQTLLKHQQRNCSPLRRRMHHVADDIVSAVTTKDKELDNYAFTNGDSEAPTVSAVK